MKHKIPLYAMIEASSFEAAVMTAYLTIPNVALDADRIKEKINGQQA